MCSEQTSNWQQQHIANTKRLALWTFIWLVTMAIASFGPPLLWAGDEIWSIIAITLNVLVGFRMIWANKIQLQGLDELQQKVQLEAMGITLGIGLVLGLAYSNLDTANVMSSDAEISHMVMIMGVTYLISTVIGLRKYQ
ncbi:MAG: hypothetical protein ACFHVJ_04945 [Aestuariibacter sp.]